METNGELIRSECIIVVKCHIQKNIFKRGGQIFWKQQFNSSTVPLSLKMSKSSSIDDFGFLGHQILTG